ncbi:unnamed protein product [Peronospora belbahrii]|uniref:Uncharacterized protein n=1 Tax=Peronospora belbahrii TaxID=622444 RepID=A0ABN8CUU7_9STRA|nr:unnamed protein product [Peronospora belbahrii]
MKHCVFNDIDVLTYFLKSLGEYGNSQASDAAIRTMLLNYLIVFSEMWEKPTPSISEMTSRFTKVRISSGQYYQVVALYCAFTKEFSAECDRLAVGDYQVSTISYGVDQYFNQRVTIPSQASVLLMSSKLSTATPHKYAEILLEQLIGDKKESRLRMSLV